MNKTISILAVITLSSCSMANEHPITIPNDSSQRLIANSLSMTVEPFFKAYMSSDIEQRRLAEMYLVGVLDSTEGHAWCGFSIASPNAIQEQAYIALKKASEQFPERRVSEVISAHFMERLPCKEQ